MPCRSVQVWPIAAIALCGHVLSLTISVLVARRLGIEQFEAYAVSASACLLMVSVAPLGLDKYSVQVLPVLLERRDLGRAHGFLRFGVMTILASAVAIAVCVGAAVSFVDRFDSLLTAALIASCLALPAGALAHFGIEVTTALGGERRATAVLRLLVPILALGSFGLTILVWGNVGGAAAIASWGFAWACGVAILAVGIRKSTPAGLWTSVPLTEPLTWVSESFSFLAYRGALALLSQSSILLLSIVAPTAVGAYAVAVAATAPVVALFTATNRAYGRRLSITLERRDYNAIFEVRKARLRWLLPAIAAMLLISLVFPDQLVGIFGLQHSDEAVASLRILALASSFTMTFSLAPTYIKFNRDRRLLLVAVTVAVAVQSLLLIVLAPPLGATGAALAHSLVIAAMYGAFALVAWRDLLKRRVKAR
jgi:O-antigen/teichoic acid export membrane protein